MLISGCVQVEFSSVYQRVGTATHSLSITIPEAEYDQAEASGQLAAYDLIAENAESAGIQVDRFEDDDSVVIQVSVERPNGEDAGAALNSLLNATGINQSPGISAPFTGSFRPAR